MRGTDVRVLQDFLTKWGVRTTVDGVYGRGTASRVRTWERATQRPVDGRMSRADSAELRRAVEAGETRAGAQGGQVAAPTEKATIGPDGLAVAPASAPDAVKTMIEAGNQIATKPYKYGGGHGQWDDTGYDCSGSMSYVMHAAGLLDEALDSTGFESYGESGEGQWVTHVRQLRPLLHADRRPALRHQRARRRRLALARLDALEQRLHGAPSPRPLTPGGGPPPWRLAPLRCG